MSGKGQPVTITRDVSRQCQLEVDIRYYLVHTGRDLISWRQPAVSKHPPCVTCWISTC
jgi:hypothetical protein